MAPQTNTPAPAPPPAADGMTFDATPTATAITVPAPPPPPSSNATDGGMTFDATPTANAITVPDATQQQTTQQPPTDTTGFPQGTVSADPGPPTLGGKFERYARNLNEDLRDGTDLTGIGTVLKRMGAHGLGNGAVGNFMGSPLLGIARAFIGASELSQGKAWPGIKDTVGGTLDAGTIPLSIVAPEVGEAAAGKAGEALDEVAQQAARAANAVKAPFSVKAIQPGLQDSIIGAIRDTAKEHGITLPNAASVRDITQTLSDAVRGKAHAIYQQLYSALGGTRFQAWDDQLGNIQRAMRESLGIDPEKDAALAKRLQDVTAARNAAMDTIRGKGLDPDDLIGQADKLHQRAMALQDVSKAVRSSTDVHPSLAADGGTAPAKVKTAPLFKRLNGLSVPNPKYPGTPSRLVQALGQERADALLHTVDAAHLYAQKIAARQKMLGTLAKATGLGGLGYEAVSGLHHLLGGDGQ